MPEYPETKREPCRCGGTGVLNIIKKEGIRYYRVYCAECSISTFAYQDMAFAVKRWNDVMADKTAKIIHNDEVDIDYCENCHTLIMLNMGYCPHCGRKLVEE